MFFTGRKEFTKKLSDFFEIYLCGVPDLNVQQKDLFKYADLIADKRYQEFFLSLKKLMTKQIFTAPPGSVEAFKVKYRHKHVALDYFEKFVKKKIFEAYNKNPGLYHSLYFSIVQSSGFGKTRLVLEAGKTHLNVVYCCLRPSGSSGYPLCNVRVWEHLQLNNSVNAYKIFIMCTYVVACNCKVQDPKIPPLAAYENAGSESVKFLAFWNSVITFAKKCKSDLSYRRRIEAFYRLGQLKANSSKIDDNFYFEEKLKNGASNIFLSHLLIVFDEARSLLQETDADDSSIFRNLRKAQKQLHSTICALVFIDTLSSVSQFQPSRMKDPSSRPESTKFNLLPPFYEILTNDPVAEPVSETASREEKLARVLSFGRPMWLAYYFEDPCENLKLRIYDAIKFAKQKLSYVLNREDNLNKDSILASMAVRFGINGIMDHTLASTFMSSYLGTCVYIGTDRLRMLVQYVPEPIVAEAASQIIHGRAMEDEDWDYSVDSSTFANYLELFGEKLTRGLVDVGDLGELLARVVLSLAYDYAHITLSQIGSDNLFTDSISLKTFLNVLLPKSYRDSWKKKFQVDIINIPDEDLDKFHVAFTSWIPLHKRANNMFNQANLKLYYDRRCAIILPVNHKGADLVIPMRKELDGTYSMIVVQIKLMKDYDISRFTAAGEALKPSSYFAPESIHGEAVGIYMELDDKDNDGTTFQRLPIGDVQAFNRNYPRHIMLVDLCQEFFDRIPNLRGQFKFIQESTIDYAEVTYRSENLKHINSISYLFSRVGCRCQAISPCKDYKCGCMRNLVPCSEDCHFNSPCANILSDDDIFTPQPYATIEKDY